MTKTLIATAALLFASGCASTGHAAAASGSLPLDIARGIADAALESCTAQGQRVSVAIVDRDGSTRVLLKADGAGAHTVGSSTGKAFASASLGQETAAVAAGIAGNPELAGLRDMDPRLVILAGGLPIRLGGELVGGIGVGGAPSGAIDADCARAGLAAGADVAEGEG